MGLIDHLWSDPENKASFKRVVKECENEVETVELGKICFLTGERCPYLDRRDCNDYIVLQYRNL